MNKIALIAASTRSMIKAFALLVQFSYLLSFNLAGPHQLFNFLVAHRSALTNKK